MGGKIVIIVTLVLAVISTYKRARLNYKLSKFDKEHKRKKAEKAKKELDSEIIHE